MKVISNAGGVNPEACAAALRAAIAEKGFDLKVACVTGDDLLPQVEALGKTGLAEMFTGDDFPNPERVLSANAYLGAFPVAAALSAGADIVVTGRCVDSAVTLGACLHAFGWESDDWDRLAMGSLAGHILECGPQATGGNFTDWEAAGNIANIGYPVAEIETSGVLPVSNQKAPRVWCLAARLRSKCSTKLVIRKPICCLMSAVTFRRW